MTMTNAQLLAKAGPIVTGDLAAGGLLLPEQAREFIRQVYEATPFSQLHRKELRVAPRGEIAKIGIGRRLLRKKIEVTDDEYRAGVSHSKVEYATVAARVPWEISEETLRQNLEQEGYEDLVMRMMATQIGIDLEDLHFNGDETAVIGTPPDTTPDPFLSINHGWIRQIRTGAGANLVDCTLDTGFGKDTLFRLVRALPKKYLGGNTRWIMSPHRRLRWIEYLTNRATGAGDAALLGAGDQVNRPLGYPIVEVPSCPDNQILLTDPKNFVAINTYAIKIRKTIEGREAVLQDKRIYVIHLDDDPIIEELEAAALAFNVPETLAAG